MKRNVRIVFMGTPDFAVASLDILVQHKYEIAAVVTAPDKPAGRGQQLHQSAVKKYAVEKGLTVLQPEKLKNPAFIRNYQRQQNFARRAVAAQKANRASQSRQHFPPFDNRHSSIRDPGWNN